MGVVTVGPRKHWALATIKPIKWLISCEPELRAAIEEFAADKRGSPVTIAGPPSDEDVAKRARRDDFTGAIPLPVVTLHLKKKQHHLSLIWGIEVTASDGDVQEIVRWAQRKQRVRQLALLDAQKQVVS